LAVEAGFDMGGVVGVIEKRDLLTDQSDGGLKEDGQPKRRCGL